MSKVRTSLFLMLAVSSTTRVVSADPAPSTTVESQANAPAGVFEVDLGAPSGFFVGWRGALLELGAGTLLEYNHNSAMGFDGHATLLSVEPQLRLHWAPSSEPRMEGYVLAGAGYGRIWGGSNQPQPLPNVSVLTARVGAGMQYYLAPAFAIGGQVGIFWIDQHASGYLDSLAAQYAAITVTSLF
jgi:hypothetical protein